MITRIYANLLWKIVKDSLFGFPAENLVCTAYSSGGGFAGAPEQLKLALRSGVVIGEKPAYVLDVVEFPMPSASVQYIVGGNLFHGYNYVPQKEGA